jgi:hypothetical protein
MKMNKTKEINEKIKILKITQWLFQFCMDANTFPIVTRKFPVNIDFHSPRNFSASAGV